jgi:hypothetical protein
MNLANMDSTQIKQIISQYEFEKQTLQDTINNLEKEYIIKNERLAQLKTNLKTSYGTDDPEELKKILDKSIQDLDILKQEIDEL